MFSKFYNLGFLKVQYLGHFYSTFINDFYLRVSKADLLSFADDKTISAAENTTEKLISTFEETIKLLLLC